MPQPAGAGRKQLKIIQENIQVKINEATQQAFLESLEVFRYDKTNNKDMYALTKGEGVKAWTVIQLGSKTS